MRATARALKERSLDLFKKALKDYQSRESQHLPLLSDAEWQELQQDPLIRTHLTVLYDTLLEQNLIRVIEPYSSVELSWIAQEVGQDVQVVEDKLSQMILDQVFYGVLNENEGTLEVHDEPTEDVRIPIHDETRRTNDQVMFSTTLEVEKQLQQVIKQLYEKVSFSPHAITS